MHFSNINLMNITTELYSDSISRLPKTGQHITAHQNNGMIVVYQAYNHQIADFAVENQFLGGDAFSYSRMSWIKPNFLWMMYRCGWATKENQERVLALWIGKDDFEAILNEAVFSSFNPKYYSSQEEWRDELNQKKVRLQWDPEHDPYGNKIERRAIQLGLKGDVLESFGRKQVKQIEDVTAFAKEQFSLLQNNRLNELIVPVETVYQSANKKIGIDGV